MFAGMNLIGGPEKQEPDICRNCVSQDECIQETNSRAHGLPFLLCFVVSGLQAMEDTDHMQGGTSSLGLLASGNSLTDS